MTRRCTICDHPHRDEIESALVAREPYRDIAERFSVSTGALSRHAVTHIPHVLSSAREADEVTRGDVLLEQVQSLQDRAMRILDEAEDAGDLRVALQAIREARGNVELMAKLRGQLNEGGPLRQENDNIELILSDSKATALALELDERLDELKKTPPVSI